MESFSGDKWCQLLAITHEHEEISFTDRLSKSAISVMEKKGLGVTCDGPVYFV